MREILFRGKSVPGGRWLYGDYMSYAGGAQIWTHDADGGTWNAIVDLTTVGQYTGLTDKNGKKIFDGDILESHYDDNHPNDSIIETIVWQGNGWCIKQGSLDPDPIQATNILSYSKVVGSIHDNPELLEDE